jgi:hypothetical protein
VTVKEITERLESIRAAAEDPESAHCAEDQLHFDVLTAIATGAENPRALASEAVKSKDVDFPRWCA